jgi:DNA-binding winged helix-turn-helix (wHTH) protein/tetratricopeptide (TPR) repeat protein
LAAPLPTEAPRALRFGPYRLDFANEWLLRGDELVPLAPKPFAVLRHLVTHAGRLVTKDELLDAVWPDAYVGDAVLKVAVGKVRRALADDGPEPAFISTVSRRGYRFVAPVEADDAAVATGAGHAPGHASREEAAPAAARLPFVGRRDALRALDESLARALGGERQLVFVTGDAGIGKTTLLDAWVEGHRSGWRLGRGQCLEQFGVTEAFLPVLEAIGGLCQGPSGAATVDRLRRVAPSWLVQMPWLIDESARLALQREIEGATRERMLRELAELTETLAAEEPLVLLLEDLHWSDPSTLDVLSFLAQRRQSARLLVLGSYRPVDAILDDHPIRELKQKLAARRLCSEIALPLLGEDDVARYVEMRLDGAAPPRLATIVHQRTGGSPLFVASVLEHLLERRLLVHEDRGWRLAASAHEVERAVPDGLREMIERRIERLAPGDVALLEAASVAGVEFSSALVAASAELSQDEVEQRCERLAHNGDLIRDAGAAGGPAGVSARYAFQHGLFQNVLYERTPVARRRRLHKRLGSWLEREGGMPGELAHHFMHAGLPDDLEKAAVYAQRAGARARTVFAYDEAARHFQTAITATEGRDDADPAERCALLLEHAEALERAAAIQRAEDAFRRAAEIARTIDGPEMFAESVLGVGRRYGRLNPDPALVGMLEEAIVRLGKKAPPLRARLLAQLDFNLSSMPGTQERRAALRSEAIRLARASGDPVTRLWVAQATRWAFRGAQTRRQLERELEDLNELIASLTDPEDRMNAHLLRVTDYFEVLRIDDVRREIELLERQVAKTPIPWFAWFVLRFKAMRALLVGSFAEAERLIEEAHVAGQGTEHPHVRPVYRGQHCMLLLERATPAEAEPELARVAEVSGMPVWRSAVAHVHALMGRREEAQRAVDDLARDDFAHIAYNHLWLPVMAYLAQTCVLLGDRRRAAVLERLLRPHADRLYGATTNVMCLGHGGRYLGLLYGLLGRIGEATRHFERALAENARMGARPWLASTELDFARLLARQRSRSARTRAAELVERARTTSEDLGMRGLLEQLQQLE